MAFLNDPILKNQLTEFLKEDEISKNYFYQLNLPKNLVEAKLKIKSSGVIAGLPFFIEVFHLLDPDWQAPKDLLLKEGHLVDPSEWSFKISFAAALSGERVALNLLQRMSAIATYTKKFVEKAEKYQVKILDTRKTTPGLRSFEKYAVRIGGGQNHRFGQTDLWMIKDNHKACLGGLEAAYHFFINQGVHYQSIEAEIHSLEEMDLAQKLGIKFLMLDNFSPEKIKEAINRKSLTTHFELSGGINEKNLDEYLISGVDAISMGALTYHAPPFDISLKLKSL
jgi:nicotinate-nucleotide pyrophosphorylase (carboxylating)